MNIVRPEMYQKAFKIELEMHCESFIVFSRNNGIPKRNKIRHMIQPDIRKYRTERTDEIQKLDNNREGHTKITASEESNDKIRIKVPTNNRHIKMTDFESLGPSPLHKFQTRTEEFIDKMNSGGQVNDLHENIPFLLKGSENIMTPANKEEVSRTPGSIKFV